MIAHIRLPDAINARRLAADAWGKNENVRGKVNDLKTTPARKSPRASTNVIPGRASARTRYPEIPGSMRSLSSGRASRGPGGIAPE
jgi:hypothetical protein